MKLSLVATKRASTTAGILVAAAITLMAAGEVASGQAVASDAVGSISGVVIGDDPSERPISRVAVTLRSAALPRPLVALTDQTGGFAFTRLPPAHFTVTASKPAYLTLAYGQVTPGRGSGLPIALQPGEQVRDLRLRLPRGSVISGRVVDERSRPVANAPVLVMQYRTLNGERVLTNVGGSWPHTDAHGRYRAYGLAAGDYFVCAYPPGDNLAIPQDCGSGGGAEAAREVTAAEVQWARQQLQGNERAPFAGASPAPPPGRSFARDPVFYPGVTGASAATAVTIDRGEDRQGIDLVMTRSPRARVTVKILGVDGQPAVGANVRFSDGFGTRGLTSPDGGFVENSLAPGRYALMARLGDATGTLDFSVEGRNLDDLVLQLSPVSTTMITLAGRVAFEGTTLAPPANLEGNVRVTLTGPALTGTFAATTRADGSFALSVAPGRYQMLVALPNQPAVTPGPSWQLKAAIVNGKDASDTVLDLATGDNFGDIIVTFTDRVSSLSGTLQDAAGRIAPGYYVVVFSTDRSFWRAGARRLPEPVRVGTDGSFRFANLPAGSYHLAALTEVNRLELYDEAFLEALKPSALLVTLADGEQKTQALAIK
jgi:hypothetical protein